MSSLYASAREKAALTGLNWVAGAYGVLLIGPGFIPDYEVAATLADIGVMDRITGIVPLENKAATNGFCTADDAIMGVLSGADQVAGAVVVEMTGGDEENFPLVLHIDHGFNVPMRAGPAALVWAPEGIFRL